MAQAYLREMLAHQMETAFEELWQHEPAVRRLATALVFADDPFEADDVVQETMLRAWRKRPADPDRARAYLSSTLRHVIAEQRRRTRRQRQSTDALDPDELGRKDDIEEQLAQQEVVRALQGLPERERNVVFLYFFADLGLADIGRKLGIPTSTAGDLLSRGKRSLRISLDRTFGTRHRWILALLPLANVPAPVLVPVRAFAALRQPWLIAAVGAVLIVALLWAVVSEHAPTAIEPAGIANADLTPPVRGPDNPVRTPMPPIAPATLPASGPASLRGRVLDINGRPLAGTLVKFLMFEPWRAWTEGHAWLVPNAGRSPIETLEAHTDAAGTFHLQGAWPYAHGLLALGLGSEHPTLRHVVELSSGKRTVDLGDLRLVARGRIRGRLVDEEGAPVAGATVIALDLPTYLQGVPIAQALPGRRVLGERVLESPAWVERFLADLAVPQACSGLDGGFALIGVPLRQGQILVKAKGHALLAKGIHPRDLELDAGVLALRRAPEVTVDVCDSTGAPVPGAEVLVGSAGWSQDIPWRVEAALPTDARGRTTGFVDGSSLLCPGIVIAARQHRGHRWTVVKSNRMRELVAITLPVQARVQVALRSRHGAPIEGLRLRWFPGANVGELGIVGILRSVEPQCSQLAPGRVKVEGLLPGAYVLLAEAEGHARWSQEVEIPSDRPIELNVELPTGQRTSSQSLRSAARAAV